MRLAALVIVSLALGVLAAATADADARGLELAVQDDPVLLQRSYGDAEMALDRARAMGARRIRVNLAWADAMPRRGELDVAALERLLDGARTRGIRLQVSLTGPAPAYATSTGKTGSTRPSARRYGEFAAAVARHFEGRIDRYSIWNEPNWHRLLAPASKAPRLYRALYRAGFDAIRRADPRAQVLFGELMPGANRRKSTPALRFLRAVLCRGCSPLTADGVALHPYNFARRPRDANPANRDVVEMGSLSRLTATLDANRRRLRPRRSARMPVYLTEFGYFTEGPVARTPRTHARWMAEAWRIADRNPRVRQLLQYQLVDPWPDTVTWRTAVLDRDGSPRPVYDTLRALASGG